MKKGYVVICPAENIVAMSADYSWDVGNIDYAKHPAYREHVLEATLKRRAVAISMFYMQFTLLLLKRLIRYEMIPYSYRKPRTINDRLMFVAHSIKNIFRGNGKAYNLAEINEADKSLRKNGIIGVKMPDECFTELRGLADSHFDRLTNRRGTKNMSRDFAESRSTVDPRDSSNLIKLIETILEDSGILDLASKYTGRKMRLIDANPQINDTSDSFWRDIFPDREGEDIPRAAYHHRDASGGDLKAIIYYSDVGVLNGPFEYAVGSNLMPIGRLDDLLREANDHNGFSSTTIESRKLFSALPKRLRQKGAFGNDLPDDSDLTEAIANAEWQVIGSAGSIVLFDTKGIHRGGMIKEGERRVITCVLG